MSYENLDIIADAYIPLLALITLIFLFTPLKDPNGSFAIIGYKSLRLFTLIVCVYFFMFLDGDFSIFTYFGLDYSTHTALLLALISFIVWINKKLRLYLSVIFLPIPIPLTN